MDRALVKINALDIVGRRENAVRTGSYVGLLGNGITLDKATRAAGEFWEAP